MLQRLRSELESAVSRDDIEDLQELIDREGLPSDSEWIDYSLLMSALKANRCRVATMLVERGCRVNYAGLDGKTSPLHLAVLMGKIEMVELLLRKGASILARNERAETPLHLAAKLDFREYTIDCLMTALLSKSQENLVDESGLSLLHIACARDNSRLAAKLLAAGARPNEPIREDCGPQLWAGYTALHVAVQSANEYSCLLPLLLEAGADPNLRSPGGFNGLHMAARRGSESLVEQLLASPRLDLEARVDGPAHELQGWTALHLAALHRHASIVQLLVSRGLSVNSRTSPLGYAPLHVAMQDADSRTIRALIERGADLNATNAELHTPLHLAVIHQHYRLVKYLIEFGADLNAQQASDGYTALHIACLQKFGKYESKERPFADLYELGPIDACSAKSAATSSLVPSFDSVGKLSSEQIAGHSSGSNCCIVELICQQARITDKNPLDRHGLGYFHIGCMSGNLAMAREYISRGVSPGQRLKDSSPVWPGNTALHLAVLADKRDVVELLLHFGADPAETNASGLSPIHLTLPPHQPNGCNEILLHLLLDALEDKISRCEREAAGLTRLHLACMRDCKNFADLFSELEIEVDRRVDDSSAIWPGCSPLHLALQFGRAIATKYLIDHAADVNAKDLRGWTPLHYACTNANESLIKYLLKHDADVDCVTVDEHKTPLFIAISQPNSNSRVIQLLLDFGSDINIEDAQGNTSLSAFYESSCKDVDFANRLMNNVYFIYEYLYTHIEKMRIVNYYISDKIIRVFEQLRIWLNCNALGHSCGRWHSLFTLSCQAEVEELKRIVITKNSTLYDILFKDANQMASLCQNDKLVKMVYSRYLAERKSPIYGHILHRKFKHGMARRDLLEPATSAMNSLIGSSLPAVLWESIFRFLSNCDLISIIKCGRIVTNELENTPS
ncbi:hypothetical protein TKK_0014874 [Trichogramma kaykai]|uniref:PRANC domain-containing protein n=1 Tax=Trichogramma kaykai TaxID=54128 RepID=A0ABD2WBY0_9HYME